MSLFIDTSALLALLDADSEDNLRTRDVWTQLVTADQDLVCTNYILLETVALAQKRLGLEAVRTLYEDLIPLLRVIWVDPATHEIAVNTLFAAGRRNLSLVDCTSFAVMRRLGLNEVFALDRDFARQGFLCRP